VGNAARSASALNAELHIVGPCGFQWNEKKAKRASVGYWNEIHPLLYRDAQDFWSRVERGRDTQWIFAEKDGEFIYSEVCFGNDVVLFFGNEEEGVDPSFWKHESLPVISSCRIPMHKVRCLNLATSVGIVGYEIARQWGHKEGAAV
jgi:tRNA (cytidine/uridine-2'-O-)-methyltransferase